MAEKEETKKTSSNIKIFVAAGNMTSLNNIIHLLGSQPDFEVVDTAMDGEDCLAKIVGAQADILLVDFNLPKVSGVKIAEYLSFEAPYIATVILGEQSNLSFFRSAMLAGAREFLVMPVPAEELAFAIHRVYALEQERREKSKTGPAAMAAPKKAGLGKNGKFMTAISGKGGTGKSLVISNLANLASDSFPKLAMALIDFDLHFGDMAVIYDVTAKKSLLDFINVIDELDPDILKSVAVQLKPNLDLFVAPPQLEKAELLTTKHISKLLDAFKENYDLIFINTGPDMTENHIEIMEKTDFLLLVANQDVPSIKTCAQLKAIYDKLGLPAEGIGVVLNKFDSGSPVTPQRVQENVKVPVVGAIPSLPKQVQELLNDGKLASKEFAPHLNAALEQLFNNVQSKLGLVLAAAGTKGK